MEDAAGSHFIDASQSIPLVASAANAPVFVLDDVNLGNGAVGGYLLSWVATGQIAGGMALKILNGEKLENIPVVKSTNSYMFDWRALRRWGLKESDLPPGAVLLHTHPGVWELYKSYIIGGTFLILVEALLIVGLVWQRLKRRKTEAELAISYERLRMAVDAGRFVGWDLDVKNGQNSWFGDLQGMFGIMSDTYVAQIGDFTRHVHPADRDLVLQTIDNARQSKQPYVAECRLQRDDGAVRWIIARGKFYYASNGAPERMLGLALDVTQRKMVEEALSTLSGRLIDAQEEERKRIAREIHDDYNQRLALLAFQVEELSESIGDFPAGVGQRLHQICNGIGELGGDLHSLSHRLHSSTLERLGLVPGVKAFVDEFAAQQQIQIAFTHENVPPGVAEDVALCLFRVVQEGLRNIKRHSGTHKGEVRVEGSGEKLHLSIIDRGWGFNMNECSPRAGIGIRSMQERLRSLGGQFEITSRPTEGTRIDAWVPLKTASRSAA
jgi:signal transduction histidine kinase